MKFSFSYVKKNPVMFGAIFIVFGLLIWLMLNKSAAPSEESGGASTSYVTAGPSDAQVAAQTQLGMASLQLSAANAQTNAGIAIAQIQAAADDKAGNLQLAALGVQGQNAAALAAIEAKVALEETAAAREVSKYNTDAQVTSMMAGYAASLASQQDNNKTQLAFLANTNAAAIENSRINADLQKTLSGQQLEAFKVSSILSIVPTLKKKDRDETLQIIGGAVLGAPVSYYNGPGAATVYGGGTAPNQDVTGGSSVMAITGGVFAA